MYVLCRSFFYFRILFRICFCFVSFPFILVASTKSLSLCAGKFNIRVAAIFMSVDLAILTSALVLETVSFVTRALDG